MTIVEFLMARIAEDEAVARAARPHEHLRTRDNASLAVVEDDGYSTCSITSGRVLRECEIKRRIVGRCAELLSVDGWEFEDEGVWSDVNRRERYDARCDLEELAAVYADHPDYRSEWLP